MEPQSNIIGKVVFAIIAGMLLGGGAGFYYGKVTGGKEAYTKGHTEGYTQGSVAGEQKVRDEIASEEQRKAEEAAQAVNPFNASTNPFAGSVNPFEEVKINPFK